jgi:ribonuclease P protein component
LQAGADRTSADVPASGPDALAKAAPRMATLKKRADFLKAMAARRVGGPFFLLGIGSNDADAPRVGYTVTKKQGNSVKRNRIRRRLRAIVRENAAALLPGHDHVIAANADVLTATPARLKAEWLRRLGKAAMARTETSRPAPDATALFATNPATLATDRTDHGQ